MKFVVTAGPTREHLDPVRFLSNPSTGKMGFAVAAEANENRRIVVPIISTASLQFFQTSFPIGLAIVQWCLCCHGQTPI